MTGWIRATPNTYGPVEGEIELRVKAGGGVMIHGNLWHRGLPTLNAKRRMLILSYTPTWLRKSPHGGAQPEDGLTHAYLKEAKFGKSGCCWGWVDIPKNVHGCGMGKIRV